MKKFQLIILVIMMIFIVGCDKESNENTSSETTTNETSVTTEATKPVVSEGEWESYFEDPLFAKALRNGLEEQILLIPTTSQDSKPKQLEDYGIENVFKATKVKLVLRQINPFTGEDLGEDYRSKITSIKGIENFINVYNIDLNGLISISEADMNASLKLINSNSPIGGVSSEVLNLSNTNVSDLSFIKYPDFLKKLYLSNTKITDGTLESLVGLKLDVLDISQSEITKLPNLDYSLLSTLYMKDLANFDSTTLSNVDLNNVLFLNTQGTKIAFEDISVMSKLLMLQAGATDMTISSFQSVDKTKFPSLSKLILKLDSYGGLGDYLKSGVYQASDLVLVSPMIDNGFLDELIGKEIGDASGYTLRVITPQYDESLIENDTGDYIEVLASFVTMFIDEIENPMPKEVETYFSGKLVIDGIFDYNKFYEYLVERVEEKN